LKLSAFNLLLTILVPFTFFGLYFLFAFKGYWVLAILSTISLSFTTYGSSSHDLVHKNLGLNNTLNELLLSIMEAISMRSGHAYRLSHLHHHNRFPHHDDIEGAASKMTFIGSLFEGVIFQIKLYFWALRNYKTAGQRGIILAEGTAVLLFVSFSIYSLQYTPVFFLYTCLMIAGSWIIPLITSYLVHTPEGAHELEQTKLFRGKFFSIISFEHLYHLEHHLYPMVPHKNWPALARRLDPYFKKQKIKPVIFNEP
jgi:beta-carotene hydroxylase